MARAKTNTKKAIKQSAGSKLSVSKSMPQKSAGGVTAKASTAAAHVTSAARSSAMAHVSPVTHPTHPVILLIEDHPDITEMYKVAFKKRANLEIHTAIDKSTSLAMARQLRPDLILLDIIIPEKNNVGYRADARYGFEVLEEVRRDPQIQATKVLVLTNLDSPRDRAKARKLGALEYIVKASVMPFEVVEKSLSTIKKGKK